MEGMATQRNLFRNTTLTERVCSLCSNSHSLTYCMAVENLLGITPPPRARCLRILAEETKRVASHLFNIAIFAHNIGFRSLFLHIMEVRENMQDVKETLYGNRMNLSVNCIGGVKCDITDDLANFMRARLNVVEEAARGIERIFLRIPSCPNAREASACSRRTRLSRSELSARWRAAPACVWTSGVTCRIWGIRIWRLR